jgi:hypothetical protein
MRAVVRHLGDIYCFLGIVVFAAVLAALYSQYRNYRPKNPVQALLAVAHFFLLPLMILILHSLHVSVALECRLAPC